MAFNDLANSMPVRDEKAAQREKTRKAIQLQSMVSKLESPQQPGQVEKLAGAVGTKATQDAGQVALQRTAAQAKEGQQLQGQAIGAEAVEQQAALGSEQLQAGQQQLQAKTELSETQREATKDISAMQIDIAQKQMKQKEYQETVQIDYAVSTADSNEELQDNLQKIDIATKRNLTMINGMNEHLLQIIQNEGKLGRQKYTNTEMLKIKQMQVAIAEQAKKIEANAANKAKMMVGMGMLGGIAGGAAGWFGGGAGGAAAGAAGGATAGTAAGERGYDTM